MFVCAVNLFVCTFVAEYPDQRAIIDLLAILGKNLNRTLL